MNLENEIRALPPVQVCLETKSTNGCLITMIFPTDGEDISPEIVNMLTAAFEKKRRETFHEKGDVPVQGIHEKPGVC